MAIEEPDFAAEVGQQMNGGRRRKGGKTPIEVDTAQVGALGRSFKAAVGWVKDLRKEVKGLAAEANQAGNAMGGIGQAAGARTSAAGTPKPPQFQNSSQASMTTAGMTQQAAGGKRPGLIGPFGSMRGYLVNAQQNMGSQAVQGRLIGGYIAGQVAGQVMGGVDRRIDRGAEYALSADRIGVAMQQRYGTSQMGYMRNIRGPLQDYRLGAGGMNDLLQFQMQTGMNAAGLAQGVEGLRALSGWGASTQDILSQQASMLNPQTANRMFMMLGTGPIGLGGTQTDPIKMRQQIMRTMGLDNMTKDQLERGLRPGSILRARMADAGLSTEMQEQMISYAQSQQNFKAAGGQGMYDPSSKKDRKLMGIEDNFATQVEETERQRAVREEDFMKRQVDNLASMEKNTQQMVKLMGSIEDKLSALVGARTSTRGWQRMLGTGLMAGGAIATALGVSAPVGIGMMAAGGALSASGDPPESGGTSGPSSSGPGSIPNSNDSADGNIQVPFGYGGGRVSLNELKTKHTFSAMNGKMQQRLLALFRASGGKVGIGGGIRDPKQQEAMFRDRYRPDPNGDVTWNGQKWKRVKGAPAAPPGRSMHEIGLAADLVGDMDWLQANAGRFGLKTFADVNNEPWHVQPTELPNSRREYEANGASWGSDGGFDPDADFSEGSQKVEVEHPNGRVGTGGGGGGGVMAFGQDMSISDIIQSMESANAGMLGSGIGGGMGGGDAAGPAASSGESVAATGATFNAGGLSGAKLAAAAAYAAGFRGEDLFKIVSIAGRESGFDPTAINKSSRDTGMWQIAPMNWGQYSQQDLLDPMKNAQVAYKLFKSSGFHGWKAAEHRMKNDKGQWVVDPSGQGGAGWAMNGNELWHTESHQATAREAISALDTSGDGAFDHGGRKSAPMEGRMASVAIAPPAQPDIRIEIKPDIKFVGTPAHTDLQALAQQVTAMIEQGVREANMRTA